MHSCTRPEEAREALWKGRHLAGAVAILLAEHDDLELVIARQHTSAGHGTQNVGTRALQGRCRVMSACSSGQASGTTGLMLTGHHIILIMHQAHPGWTPAASHDPKPTLNSDFMPSFLTISEKQCMELLYLTAAPEVIIMRRRMVSMG